MGCKSKQEIQPSISSPSLVLKEEKKEKKEATVEIPKVEPSVEATKTASIEAPKVDNKSPKEERIRILYLGSWEGTLLPFMDAGKKSGGLAWIVSLTKKRTSPYTMIFSTGDLLSGDISDTKDITPALNMLNLSASALGNLELNYGAQGIKKRIEKISFPILSANVYEGEKRLFEPYLIREINGIKIGIIGLTTEESAVQVVPEMIKGLTFRDPIRECGLCLKEIEGKVDIIIVLSNMRYEKDILLAEAYPKIGLILGRYDVDPTHLMARKGNVLISRINSKKGKEIGEIEILKMQDSWQCTMPKIYQIGPEGEDSIGLSPDEQALAFIQECQKQEKEMNEVIFENKQHLHGDYQDIRQKETNLGNLFADILLETRQGAEVALINSGCIRSSIPPGPVTKEILRNCLPYNNKIVEISLRGDILKEVLENSVAQYEKISGAFLQVAGLTFSFDTRLPKFSRVTEIKVLGEPLVQDKKYKVVTLDYITGGGDDYVMLKDYPVLYVCPEPMLKIMENYLKVHPDIKPGVEGRIIIK